MSVLTMTPSHEWDEAPDIEDEGDDTVPTPSCSRPTGGLRAASSTPRTDKRTHSPGGQGRPGAVESGCRGRVNADLDRRTSSQ
jgi:hypothetical protein